MSPEIAKWAEMGLAAVGGAILSVLVPFLAQWWNLSRALRVETDGALRIHSAVREGLEEGARAAELLLEKIRCGEEITSVDLEKIKAGCIVSPPKVDFFEMVTRWPRKKPATVIAKYLDVWSRFVEYELRYTKSLDRLLERLSIDTDHKPLRYALETREQAGRVAFRAREMLRLLDEIAVRADRLNRRDFAPLPSDKA
jgi:hypothetical protein